MRIQSEHRYSLRPSCLHSPPIRPIDNRPDARGPLSPGLPQWPDAVSDLKQEEWPAAVPDLEEEEWPHIEEESDDDAVSDAFER